MNKPFIRTLFIFMAVTLAGCASGPKPVSRWTAPGNGKKNIWEVRFLPETAPGIHPFELSGPPLEQARLTGYAAPDGNGGWVLSVDTLKWFNNSRLGWMEGDFLTLGTLTLIPGETGSWSLAATEVPVIESLREGSLRYKDTLVYGDEAARIITNRWYRLEATAEYLRNTLKTPWFDHRVLPQKKGGSFETTVRVRLFPERFGYPEGFSPSENTQANRSRGELLDWDTAWSREQFPEHLREVRDAGTLYRDWEEMSPFLYVLYLWPELWKSRITTLELTVAQKALKQHKENIQ